MISGNQLMRNHIFGLTLHIQNQCRNVVGAFFVFYHDRFEFNNKLTFGVFQFFRKTLFTNTFDLQNN